MITVYPILCQQMRKHGVSRRELAAVANVNRITLYLKMCGIKRWKLTEVLSICCFFRTHDAKHLFAKKRLFGFVRKHYNIQSEQSQ